VWTRAALFPLSCLLLACPQGIDDDDVDIPSLDDDDQADDDDSVEPDDDHQSDDDLADDHDQADDDDQAHDDDVTDDDDIAPDDDDATPPPCTSYEGTDQEYAPIQIAAAGLPAGAGSLTWSRPADWEWMAAFSGTPGSPASHEGVDYVHDDPAVATVPILAAAEGLVVYVRLGCPQSGAFAANTQLRECGAGWGNHVVVEHGSVGTVTRYAHLEPGSTLVQAGDPVSRGAPLASMGNSGRSDVRHLHFELGSLAAPMDPCAAAQSFAAVHDSELLTWAP